MKRTANLTMKPKPATRMEPIMAENKTVEVSAKDLPLHCPPPGTAVWNLHPRVFLDVLPTGKATCPYCRAQYVFSGEKPKGH